jgi:hypothetical protein
LLPAGAVLVSGRGVTTALARTLVHVLQALAEQEVRGMKRGGLGGGGGVIPLERTHWCLQARPAATTAFCLRNSRPCAQRKCRRTTSKCSRSACSSSMKGSAGEASCMLQEGRRLSMLLVGLSVGLSYCLSVLIPTHARNASMPVHAYKHARQIPVFSLLVCVYFRHLVLCFLYLTTVVNSAHV